LRIDDACGDIETGVRCRFRGVGVGRWMKTTINDIN
jgi:hypothetical protein